MQFFFHTKKKQKGNTQYITQYQKSSFSQKHYLLSSFSLWQDFNIAANELFNISHGEVYTITHALLCEACLCHTAAELAQQWAQESLQPEENTITQYVAQVWSVICKSRAITFTVIAFELNKSRKLTCFILLALKQRHLCKFHLFLLTLSLIDHPESCLWQFPLLLHHQFCLMSSGQDACPILMMS